MKNYELMSILEKLPSGVEIFVSGTMTDAELCHNGAVDQIDGEDLYSFSNKVSDVDQDGKRIYLLVE